MARPSAAIKNKIMIKASPSLNDVEAANILAAAVPKDYPLVLELPRSTHSTLFVDTAIASLIATLANRRGRLVIKDLHQNWRDASTAQRYLHEIDGVAALVFCSKVPGAALHNTQDEAIPLDLVRQFESRLLRSAVIEEVSGQSKTYVAVDPTYSVPRELALRDGDVQAIRNEIASVIQQFGGRPRLKERGREDAEDVLHRAAVELFRNTFEHGRRFNSDGSPLPGLRYIRFQKHIAVSASRLSERAESFAQLKEYVARRSMRAPGNVRFLEVTVSDSGVGILAHFCSHYADVGDIPLDRTKALNAIVTGKLSSKRMPGTGLGLPIALKALRRLRAFVSLRTEELWLYRDYDLPSTSELGGDDFALKTVNPQDAIGPITGTQFSILIDFDI